MSADTKTTFMRALVSALRSLAIELTPDQRARLWHHRQFVIEANQRFNLTRITDPADFAVKHHADSLAMLSWVERATVQVRRVLDIGTGAGVPAIPFAIARPDWAVVAIDGTRKKADFVRDCQSHLDLGNLSSVHARAEAKNTELGGRFDLVVTKAVGSLARCLELSVHHVSHGGYVAVYKTADLERSEPSEACTTAERLGLDASSVFEYQLPLGSDCLRRAVYLYRHL